jgi:K+-sensing histidine kinase KdpD
MLSDKLGELHEAITKQNAYLNILPSEEAILTKNGTSLTSALIEKNKTDKEISDLTNSIETKLKDSERFVSNKYSIYTLLNAIAMILVAIYVWDFTFSMVTLVMIIMIIAINTSIFSGIILFLYIFFYFYFQIGNY